MVNSEKVVSYKGMEVMEHFMGLIFWSIVVVEKSLEYRCSWSSVEIDITPDEDIFRRLDLLESGFGVFAEMNRGPG